MGNGNGKPPPKPPPIIGGGGGGGLDIGDSITKSFEVVGKGINKGFEATGEKITSTFEHVGGDIVEGFQTGLKGLEIAYRETQQFAREQNEALVKNTVGILQNGAEIAGRVVGTAVEAQFIGIIQGLEDVGLSPDLLKGFFKGASLMLASAFVGKVIVRRSI